MSNLTMHGYCDPAFYKVRQVFLDSFKKKQEIGAGVSVVVKGKTVVDIWGGYSNFRQTKPWQKNTLANIFSATKAITAICALRLVQQGKLDLDNPVVEYWPEFAKNGKEKITVRMLLNHKAGMVAIKKRFLSENFYDWDLMAKFLAEQKPWWTPGKKHGYHAMTFGWLVGHVIRNVSGQSVGEYLQKEIAKPLDLDLHIGLDEKEHARTAQIIWPRLPLPHKDTLHFILPIMRNPWGATSKAFTNPWGFAKYVNGRSWRKAQIPAANGHCTANALARLYGILANGGSHDGVNMLSKEMIAKCCTEESIGTDAILNWPTRFSLGFMMSQNFPMGRFGDNSKNFGHPGAGGTIGFADVDAKLGFGYVHNLMGTHIIVDPRARALIDAAYSCLGG